MKTKQGVSSQVSGALGTGGVGIPANITAMQGQIIGPPLGGIEIVAGDCLYLKVERKATGAGVITGSIEIDEEGYVIVSDGANTATATVSSFDTVGASTVLAIETYAGAMRIGEVG